MANHLIHALNFGGDKFGFGLPVVTSIEPITSNGRTIGNLIIPNFVTRGAGDDMDAPCFLISTDMIEDLMTGESVYGYQFVINGGTSIYHFLDDDFLPGIIREGRFLAVAVIEHDNEYGEFHLLDAGHSHELEAMSFEALKVDVVESVTYTPGSFTTNRPTQVSASTSSYLTDVTPQSTSIKHVSQVSTGSVIGSLTTASKTASKVSHTTANFVSSVGETDVTASKITTTSHTFVTGVSPKGATAVTNVTATTDSAIKTLSSTTASVLTGVTETSAYVTQTVGATGGSVASLSASCSSGCLTLSWTPNTLQSVTSTTARVLTDVAPQTTNVLKSVSAATTASFVTQVSQSTTSVIASITQSTASVTGVLSNSTVTASKVKPLTAAAVNAVTATDVTFSAVSSVSSTQVVTSVSTTGQNVLTGITETSATGVKSVTVTAGSAATHTLPTFTSTTTNLGHWHTIHAEVYSGPKPE